MYELLHTLKAEAVRIIPTFFPKVEVFGPGRINQQLPGTANRLYSVTLGLIRPWFNHT